ncbi:NAD(P)H-binding protein [Crocinitomicaceae bacterium]|nr:NAD(P)H-binding protein [Crocinitomicaceae bacterium]
MNKKILVFGATGNTGIEICRDLDSKRINYSAFVRRGSETKIKVLQPNILFGDVLNTIDVDRVLKENDFTDVIIALGSRDFRGGEIRSNGTKHIVNSLNSNQKIAKLHVISANGVGNSWKNLKWFEKLICKLLISKAMKDHESQEEIVSSNKGGYHIIRPVGLTNETGSKNIIVEGKNALPNSKVSRTNVAKYLVDSLLDGKSGKFSICDE